MTSFQFPFITVAKVRARCPETGKAIRPGDRIAYYPDLRISYHESSSHFEDVLAYYAINEGATA